MHWYAFKKCLMYLESQNIILRMCFRWIICETCGQRSLQISLFFASLRLFRNNFDAGHIAQGLCVFEQHASCMHMRVADVAALHRSMMLDACVVKCVHRV